MLRAARGARKIKRSQSPICRNAVKLLCVTDEWEKGEPQLCRMSAAGLGMELQAAGDRWWLRAQR